MKIKKIVSYNAEFTDKDTNAILDMMHIVKSAESCECCHAINCEGIDCEDCPLAELDEIKIRLRSAAMDFLDKYRDLATKVDGLPKI